MVHPLFVFGVDMINPDSICACGRGKSKSAQMCQRCRTDYNTLMADSNVQRDRAYQKDECPNCGGLKDVRAKICHECYQQSRPEAAYKYRNKMRVDTCSCGRQKYHKSTRCWACEKDRRADASRNRKRDERRTIETGSLR